MIAEVPSCVMYADLKDFGGIANKDAARILLSAKIPYGGRSPRSRVDNRTFLSREIVHADPHMVNPALYDDFSSSSQILTGRIAKHHGGRNTARETIIEHYAGIAAKRMRESLDAHGLSGVVYSNEVQRLEAAQFSSESDRELLLVMLFVSTGCLANPQEAVNIVEQFARDYLPYDIGTINTVVSSFKDFKETTNEEHLGIIRIIDNAARPPIYPLNTGIEGTVIGSIASGNSINDVDIDVSRRHLHIWKDDNTWFCQGMGSTNGTVLIKGDDKSLIMVEPSRNNREDNTWPPVQIHESDTLCLGTSTRFFVMRIKG